MFHETGRQDTVGPNYVQLNVAEALNRKEDSPDPRDVPDTTNVVVTKFIDPSILEVDAELELSKKGKLIEVEFIDTGEILELNTARSELDLSDYNSKSKLTIKNVKKRNGETRRVTTSALCNKCGKNFTSSFNLKRHMTSCKLCPEEEKGPRFHCECGRSYSQESDLKKHKTLCQNGKKKSKVCMMDNCQFRFYHKAQIMQHMKRDHKMQIKDPEMHTFNSFSDFLDWKEREEERTMSYYSKQTGSNKTGVSINTYYVCQQDGSERKHGSTQKTERKNKKGRVKTGRLCWSQMNVKQYEDGRIHVTYFPSHTHQLSVEDVRHHPLSRTITMAIQKRLDYLQDSCEEMGDELLDYKKKGRKLKQFTIRALKNRARKDLKRFQEESIIRSEGNVVRDQSCTGLPSDAAQYGLTYETSKEEQMDDPGDSFTEQFDLSELKPNITTLDQCLSQVDELKVMLETNQIDDFKLPELSESLQKIISQYKTKFKAETEETENCFIELVAAKESITDNNTGKDDDGTTVYQLVSNTSHFIPPSVDMVAPREFIIISADHAEYFSTLASNIYVQDNTQTKQPNLNVLYETGIENSLMNRI